MTAKEFLQQAYIAHGEVDIKLEQIAKLQSLATRVTTAIKSTPGGSAEFGSRIENSVVTIQEQISRLADEVTNLLAIQEEVSTAINRVGNPAERKILEYRYLCFFSWQQIALLLKSSQRKIFLIHNQALKNFSVVLQ